LSSGSDAAASLAMIVTWQKCLDIDPDDGKEKQSYNVGGNVYIAIIRTYL
jgi:hypothetical protein